MPVKYALIRSGKQIRALASPVRQDIIDCMQALGPMSIAEVARELGRKADSLYYHVRELLQVKLIREVEVRRTGRRDEVVLDVVERPLKVQYKPASRANAQAVAKMSRSMLRLAERDFERGLRRQEARVDGPGRNVWAARLVGRLTYKEMIELNRHFARIEELFHDSRGRSDGTLQAFTFALAPLQDRHPVEENSN